MPIKYYLQLSVPDVPSNLHVIADFALERALELCFLLWRTLVKIVAGKCCGWRNAGRWYEYLIGFILREAIVRVIVDLVNTSAGGIP